jgi:hypothetical protein
MKKKLFAIDVCGDCGIEFEEDQNRLNCTGCDTYYCVICGNKHLAAYKEEGFQADEYEDEGFYITEICHCLND